MGIEWRSRRWRRLLNLIDGLPRNSFLREAQATDDELADAWLEVDSGAEPVERFFEWSPERAALAAIDDRLQELARILISVNGGNLGPFRPSPRPESALSRAEERRRIAAHRRLTSILLPSTPVDEDP